MDPALRELLRQRDPAGKEIEAIVRLTDPTARVPGLRIIARFGDIATCRVPLDRIEEARARDNVASLKANRVLGPEPTASPVGDAIVRPSDVRRPPHVPYRGSGVVIGLLDWGFSLLGSFRSLDGTTRLLALWDQRGADLRRRNRYGYGTIFGAHDLNAALRTANPYAALGYHPAASDPRAIGAHGTHTADIAAGNGLGGGPEGIAPAAHIVAIHLATESTLTNPLASLGDSGRVLEGIDLIRRIAAGRPFVVNASIGRHGGSHDGRLIVDAAIDALLAEQPNALCVHSAGNYRERHCHASTRLKPGGESSWRIITDAADTSMNEIEIWYDGSARIAVQLESPERERTPWFLPGDVKEILGPRGWIGRAYHRVRDPLNGDNMLDIFLAPDAPAGQWLVRLRADDVPDAGTVVHGWIERDELCTPCQARFHPEDACANVTTSTLANGNSGISVGAVNGGGSVAPFSSAGPTRDGRPKPDIVAPGVGVLAAKSPSYGREHVDELVRRSGTSMAAPHVAGCAALVLEAARGRLGAGELREIILSTAIAPGTVSNASRYGHGQLDIQRAVAAAERIARRRESPGEARRGFIAMSNRQENMPMPKDREAGRRLVAVIDEMLAQSKHVSSDQLLRTVVERTTGAPHLHIAPAHCVFRSHRNGTLGSLDLPEVRVIACPGEVFTEAVTPGDVLVRKALGEGLLTHVAVVASPELQSTGLSEAQLTPEDDEPGWFVQVVEGGFHPHGIADRYARRVRDRRMRCTPDQLVLRVGAPSTTKEMNEVEERGNIDVLGKVGAEGDAGYGEDDDTTPPVTRDELRSCEEITQWILEELEKLEVECFMSTERREEYEVAVRTDLEEVRSLRGRRSGVRTVDRKRARALVDNIRKAKVVDFPARVRAAAEKGRSTRGLKLFRQFTVTPRVIRIERNEGARVNVGARRLPESMNAIVVGRKKPDGEPIRILIDVTAPKDRYQTAVWEGLFDKHNAAPETGTYLLIVTMKHGTRKETRWDHIRVENAGSRTVRPRAESESGEVLKALTFDGSTLTLEDKLGKKLSVRAVSGMRASNPRNKEQKDFTRASCQWAKDRGPIPAGRYTVRRNTVQLPVLKMTTKGDRLRYASDATVGQWGPFRAPIHPNAVCDRDGFFIHLDVDDDGTAGCIGVHPKDEATFNLLMKILSRMSTDVPLEVRYPPSALDCYGMGTRTCESAVGAEAEESRDNDVPEPRGGELWRPLSLGVAIDDAAEGESQTSAPSWAIPADLRALGESIRIQYDEGPPWDRSKCSGTWTPGCTDLAKFLLATYPGIRRIGGYSCRENSASPGVMSLHGTGRALDIIIREIARDQADSTTGDPIAAWLIRNATSLGLQYLIWNRVRWSGSRASFAEYRGANPHTDHIHCELNRAGASRQTPWFADPAAQAVIASTLTRISKDNFLERAAAESSGATPTRARATEQHVRFVQRILNGIAGEELLVDGKLGRLTRAALARFRERNGLGADGTLDQGTELALVQRALEEIAQQSLFAQPGTKDARTDDALAEFKSRRGLPADGRVDAPTWAAIADAVERVHGPHKVASVRASADGSPNAAPASAVPSGVGDWSQVPGRERMRYVVRRLVSGYRYPPNGAAGIVGNLWAESQVLPNRVEGSKAATPMRAKDFRGVVRDFAPEEIAKRIHGKSGPLLPGVGLAQWTSKNRRRGLFQHRFNGASPGAGILLDMDAQVDYLVQELGSREYRAVDTLLRNPAVGIEMASDEVVYNFERPASVFEKLVGTDGQVILGEKLQRSHPQVQEVLAERRRHSHTAYATFNV